MVRDQQCSITVVKHCFSAHILKLNCEGQRLKGVETLTDINRNC